MRSKQRTRFKVYLRGGMISLLLAVFGITYIAQAYLNTGGPTTGGFGYVVSKTSDVIIPTTSIGLYFSDNTAHTITIQNAQLCDFGTSSGDTENMGDLATAAKGTDFNTFKVFSMTSGETLGAELDTKTAEVRKRAVDPASDCTADDLTLTINANELVRSTLTGRYVAVLQASILGTAPSNNQNSFRISAPGALVGVIGVNSSDPALAKAAQAGYNFNPAGTYPRKYGTQDIFFGTPCNISSNQTAQIHFYDIDNNNGGIQVGKIRVSITRLDTNVTVPASYTPGQFTNEGGNVYSPATGSLVYASLSFTAQPGVKYRLRMENQDNFNTVQLTLPYNSIYADISCANVTPELDPSVTIEPSPLVTVGDTVTGTFAVSETNGVSPGSFSYERRMWVETGGDETYNGADQSIHDASGSFTLAAGGTTSVTEPSPVPFTVTGGNKICGNYSITPVAPATAVAPNPTTVCVLIAKAPKIQISGGDVRVGGSAVAPCAVASANAQIVGVDNSKSNSNASYGDLAITALGTITNFGSNGLPYTAVGNLGKKLTFAYTPATGNFAGTTAPINRCLSDAYSYYSNIAAVSPAGTLSGLGAPLGNNVREIRRYTGNLLIMNNVTYQDKAYAFGSFPQVVILVDGDLTINDAVTQLDGLYIVRGQVRTCNLAPANKNQCTNRLNMNGAVVVGGDLKPWRTFGAEGTGAAINNKAETINLRPDFYYSECQRVCNSGVQTISEQEAPVRF